MQTVFFFAGLRRGFESSVNTPGTTRLEEVEFVGDLTDLEIANRRVGADSLGPKSLAGEVGPTFCWKRLETVVWLLAVIDFEVDTKEIRSTSNNKRKIASALYWFNFSVCTDQIFS